ESLFISGLIFTLAALARVPASPSPLRWWVLAFLVAFATASLRPNGFIVPAGVALAGFTALRAHYGPARLRPWLLTGLLLLAPGAWWLLNKLLATFTLIETYQRGELLYGYAPWAIRPTGPLWLPPATDPPALRLLSFALHNPLFFLRLVGGKALLFFAYARPYHSLGHALAIILLIWPTYWLAWRGARARPVWHPARRFLLTVLLGQAAIVALTVEDWDGRFLIAILPALFALAALGLPLSKKHPISGPTPAGRV
ncbi:MAG TPA: hypothetical protein VEI97_20385, partial [bacterium]|nr:hypothetical protein [bacterium]